MEIELISRSSECKTCTTNGKNFKSVISAKQIYSHIPCPELKQEIQYDLGGPI